MKGKHVVVCAGPLTTEFDKSKYQKQVNIREVEYHVMKDNSGFPYAFSEFFPDQTLNYGLREGSNLDQYKVGCDEKRNFSGLLPWLKERFEDRFKNFTHTHVCFYTMTADGEFQYRTNPDGVHVCYGFNGTGFKFLPIHGKIVVDELIKNGPKVYSHMYEAKL